MTDSIATKDGLDLPFVVPPFDAGTSPEPQIRFVWWSWHPNYPWWSKSCWGGATKAYAMKLLDDPRCSLDVYHNKLIRGGDGKFTEVADVPCKRMDIWRMIKAQRSNEKGQR
jgi:hypothetical protein